MPSLKKHLNLILAMFRVRESQLNSFLIMTEDSVINLYSNASVYAEVCIETRNST